MLNNWILLGLGAAVLFALSGIASKAATSQTHFNLNPALAALLTSIGILTISIIYFTYIKQILQSQLIL